MRPFTTFTLSVNPNLQVVIQLAQSVQAVHFRGWKKFHKVDVFAL